MKIYRHPGGRVPRGLTLIELLLAMSLLASVVAILSGALSGALHSQTFSSGQDELTQTARLAMARIAGHARQANRILIPIKPNTARNILALGGFIDNGGAGLFDEDPPGDLTNDGVAGIIGIDDDGDRVDNDDPVEPIVYYLDATTRILWERYPVKNGATITTYTTAVAEAVDAFNVERMIVASWATLLDMTLILRDGRGANATLETQVYPRYVDD